MKRKIIVMIIFFILIITALLSFTVIGVKINFPKSSTINNDGRIYGLVETIGHCMEIPVTDLKIACGRNLKDYKIEITDDDGVFEFLNLSYDSNKGSIYFVWILPGQHTIFPYISKVTLSENDPEEYVYIFITTWWPFVNHGIINQHYKNRVFNN